MTPKPMDPERLGRVRSHVTAAMADAPLSGDGAEWSTIPGVPTSMVAALLADRDYHAQQLGDLLAVVHRDGGQHTDEVGLAQSVADAKARVFGQISEAEDLRAEAPAEEVP